MTAHHWAIVGAGMLGMHLARALRRRGERVTLLEAADHPGGLADTWRLGPLRWDRHYHVITSGDSHLLRLLDELGLTDRLRWRQTRTGFYMDGRWYSLSNSREFLAFPPLGLLDKARLALTLYAGGHWFDPERLDGLTSIEWLRRWSGRRNVERLWRPLLRAKLGAAAERVSARFIGATIQRLYAARRSPMKREVFGYVQGGYASVLDRLWGELGRLGVARHLGRPVRRVAQDGDGRWRLDTDAGPLRCDRVVLTLATPLAARLCPQLTPAERATLRAVPYQGVICTSLLTRRPLPDFYVTNITDPRVPLTGLINMSALVDPAELDGLGLAYLPRYLPPDDPAFARDDADLAAEAVAALRTLWPALRERDVLAVRTSRVRRVFVLPLPGYLRRVPPVTTSRPGLFLCCSAQITDGTLNVNETLRLAERQLPLLTAA